MELTARDGQFVEYQFESIMHGSNMSSVLKYLNTYANGFDGLHKAAKEDIFAETVQFGKKTKESLRYAFSDSDQSEHTFSAKAFTKNQQDFWNKENEYDQAKEDQDKAIKQKEGVIKQKEGVIKQKDKLKDQKIELLEQGYKGGTSKSVIDEKIQQLNQKEKP